MTANPDETRIAAGYDAVYERIPHSPTFDRLWRQHSLGPEYPAGFEHISFISLPELRAMSDALRLLHGSALVDLACGMGGPGLWIARETSTKLTGVDISQVALDHARGRAVALGIPDAQFVRGSFAQTGLDDASTDAAMSVDALQYAPDKRAALAEVARILRPGAVLAFACFEFEPERVAGLPIFGTDPVADYQPLLEEAGFDVITYAETPGWRERVTATYQAVLDARPALEQELGEPACAALTGEMSLTLQLNPYRRRIFAAAIKR